jgi:DNA (cytosine-5)-methyltransferase 1
MSIHKLLLPWLGWRISRSLSRIAIHGSGAHILLLSLFCGPGGLDHGFESAGFDIGLAFDTSKDCLETYNVNRPGTRQGHCRDVSALTLADLDEIWGGTFAPEGVIGGPPCQSFSKANTIYLEADPRHTLPLAYARLLGELNKRNPIKFFAMENVTGLIGARHQHRLKLIKGALRRAGFAVGQATLKATDYNTPQNRERLFLVGLNRLQFQGITWQRPAPTTPEGADMSVRGALSGLPEPVFFERGLQSRDIPFHENHWCMKPKSPKFERPGALVPGDGRNRSFKTLAWDKPSPTVAYGHREVHVHPDCKRRLSVLEAMLLQGFPSDYVLTGSLSSQVIQVSEAVPPPMSQAVAFSIKNILLSLTDQGNVAA